jgi:hypothetical protein
LCNRDNDGCHRLEIIIIVQNRIGEY